MKELWCGCGQLAVAKLTLTTLGGEVLDERELCIECVSAHVEDDTIGTRRDVEKLREEAAK